MGMENWKPEDHDIMPPTIQEMSKWLMENYYEDFELMMTSACCTPAELNERIRMLYKSKEKRQPVLNTEEEHPVFIPTPYWWIDYTNDYSCSRNF